MYFDRYFYFRSTVVSEECLQRQILSGPSVFQEATSSFYLGYCFFQTRDWLILQTSYSHPFLERPLFYYKTAVAAKHSFKVPAKKYHSFQLNYQLWFLLGWRHVFIQRLVCYLMTSFTAIPFCYVTVMLHLWRFFSNKFGTKIIQLWVKAAFLTNLFIRTNKDPKFCSIWTLLRYSVKTL